MWSVCSLTVFRIYNFLKFRDFEFGIEAPVPPESQDISRQLFFFTSVPEVFGEQNGNDGTFFFKWRVATKLIGIQIKDFCFRTHVGSLPNVLLGGNTYKEPAGGMWGVLNKSKVCQSPSIVYYHSLSTFLPAIFQESGFYFNSLKHIAKKYCIFYANNLPIT